MTNTTTNQATNPKTGWAYINQLGKEYYNLVQQGYGLTTDTRTPRQIAIVNEIITKSMHFLYKRAGKLVNGYEQMYHGGFMSLKDQKPRIGEDDGWGEGKPTEKELTIDDLVSEATIGIIRGFHNYDPNKSAVSTYISTYSMTKMYREALTKLGHVYIPVHAQEKVRKVMRLRNSRGESLSRNQIIRKLSDSKSPYKIGGVHTAFLAYMTVTGKRYSLDEPAPDFQRDNTPSDDKLEGMIEDENAVMPDEETIQKELAKRTKRALNTLTPRESCVVEKLTGICVIDQVDKTIEEVGQEMLLTRERIRQIEAKALRKLRHPSRSQKLRSFVEN